MEVEEFLQIAVKAAGVLNEQDVSRATITEQQEHLLQLAIRDDTDRWSYTTELNPAHVQSEELNIEPDTASECPRGSIGIYNVGADGVPFLFELTTQDSAGTLVHFSAEQAEGLAIDLLVKAYAMREHAAANQDHSNGSEQK